MFTASNATIMVKDIEQVVLQLAGRGIIFSRRENDANRFAFFVDPDNTPPYLIQPKTPQ